MNNSKRAPTSKEQYQKRLDEMKSVVYAWNLTDIYNYVMCKNDMHVCNFLGFDAIMEKFNTNRVINKEFPKGRREFELSDRPERIRKGLEIVMFLCRHPRSNLKTMLGIQDFLKIYKDVLSDFDKKNSENYKEKLLYSFRKGLYRLESEAKLKNKREK